MKDFTKPPKWLPGLALALFVLGTLWWIATPSAPQRTTPVAEFAYAERVDFSDALNKVRNEPGSVEKLVFVKGLRVFPDKVIVDLKGRSSAVVADIPGEFDYNIIAGEADKQNVKKESLPMSGKDARQEYVQGPAEGGEDMFTKIMGWVMTILMFGLPLVVFFMLFRAMRNMGPGGAAGGFAKSKHKKFEPDKGPKVTFADVAGVDEAKENLELVVEFLKDPSEIRALGEKAKLQKGLLLVGPPGTGKTLLAKAVAGEAGVPFFYVNAPEFVEMYVGVGASRVRDMFDEIRKNLPCILAIDELDAVGKHRGTGVGGGNDEREQTITQLLAEIDGFESTAGLVVFGMTNRPDVLDPALLRGGRFGMQVIVPLPDKAGRLEILKVYAKGLVLDPKINLEEIASATAGFAGADLADLMTVDGPRYAVKRVRRLFGKTKKADMITREDLDEGISRKQMNGEATRGKSGRLSTEVKRLLAYHELGHAAVGEYLSRKNKGWSALWGDQVRKITIIGAGRAGGYTLMQGDEDPFCQTREQLLGMITSLLAATLAEDRFLKTRSTGASNDIDRAYDVAKKMVTQLGLSPLGPICVGKTGDNPFLGMTMAQSGGYGLGPESSNQIDHEIFMILADCAARADRILEVVGAFMHEVAPVLTEDETMLREKFAAMWDDHFAKNYLPDVSMDPLSDKEMLAVLPKLKLRVPPLLLESVKGAKA